MKILIPVDSVVSRLCGTQKTTPGTELRRSRFFVSVPCEEGTLLYHTLTGELRLLTKNETLEQHQTELTAAWYYVPNNWDEVRYARRLRSILAAASMHGKDKTAFVILPTTDCNARCYYCFERGVKHLTMTAETAKDVAEYIICSCGGKRVSIHWFGGEPLYNKEAIDIICAGLREHEIDFSSRMTSNAYYLDAKTSLRAKKDWHLNQVQITLDGTEKVYNRIKSYRNQDDNPFERVLTNIGGALDAGIRVIARLNMDAGNADDLFVLVDQLGSRFRDRAGFSAIVVILREVAGKICRFPTEQDAIKHCTALYKKIQEYGFSLETPELSGKLIVNKCIADNDCAEVILPDGSIAKCEHVNCAGTVGSIYSEKRDEKEILAWKEPAHFSECEECALLPRCGILKRCEWVKNGCAATTRIMSMRSLEKQIQQSYNKWKSESEKALLS
ncbi:MAG: radical SAM protein [Oscillospiraceae bacterium]|nr:radical SAM protein [Oscillospiraceae bacterium]